MVDALREAHRVLTPSGVLIDVRPVTAPIVVEVVVATQVVWARTVESYSAPEDLAAASSAVGRAVSRRWLVFEASLRFDFEIYCDSAAELNVYAAGRKLCGAEIPYEELEERRREFSADGQMSRLRCRRTWMLSTYRKKGAWNSV
jgi:hypothetical protein